MGFKIWETDSKGFRKKRAKGGKQTKKQRPELRQSYSYIVFFSDTELKQ